MNKKSILIVTGSDYTPQVYQAFSDVIKMGHRLFLLSDGSFEPKPGIFENHFTFDLRKTKETLGYMASQTIRFDAVAIKTSEWLTPLVALLAKQYGCMGNTTETAFCCRSKYHMRQKFKKSGVPSPKFALCRTFADLKNSIDEIGIPCVAKPVGGNASYGTFLIRDEEDMNGLEKRYDQSILYLKKKAVDQDVFSFSREEFRLFGIDEFVDMTTDYLVEEFMSGNEISIDALTQSGKTTIMGIADQIRMKPPYFVQLEERMPYICPAERQAEIKYLVEKTIASVGITDSPSHTEIIFTPEGPKIVEIGCRIGGDNIHDSVFQTTGYNLMFEAIMTALGEKRTYDIKTRCHTAMQYILPDKKGIIKDITIPDSLKKNPNITEIDVFAKKGDEVAPPPESFDFLGYVQAKGGLPREADSALKTAIETIHFYIN
jgi:biotin carboxylase